MHEVASRKHNRQIGTEAHQYRSLEQVAPGNRLQRPLGLYPMNPMDEKGTKDMATIAFLITLAIGAALFLVGLGLVIGLGIAEEIEARFQ